MSSCCDTCAKGAVRRSISCESELCYWRYYGEYLNLLGLKAAVEWNKQKDPEILPLNVTKQETQHLLQFLKHLSELARKDKKQRKHKKV